MTPTKEITPEARSLFIALATASIIWEYADEVVTYCANNKMSDVAKLSRRVRELKREYNSIVSSAMDVRQKFIADWAGKDFRDAFAYDLLVLYCTLTNELSRKYAGEDIAHLEMRGKALCAIVIRRALQKMPDPVFLPTLSELDQRLNEYVAPYKLDLTANVDTVQKILTKRLAIIPDLECNEDLITYD